MRKAKFTENKVRVLLEDVAFKEGSISQPLGALKGSGYCLEALLHREGRQLAQRFSSLADVRTTNLGQLSFVKKSSLSESESKSSSGRVRLTFLWNAEEAIFRKTVIHHT